LVAMYAVLLYGYVFRKDKPWHIVGSGAGLMLVNIGLFTAVSSTSPPWSGIALTTQIVATAAATVWMRREWVEWRSDSARA
jgi:nicotinamide riboside transporter PnuC